MRVNQLPPIHQLVVCANTFVLRAGHYLLLRRSVQKTFAPGVVHPIGGKLELNENPLRGAQRELCEEAGVEGKNFRLRAVLLELKPHPEHMPHNWLIFHFVADYDRGEFKPTEEGEFIWLTPEEVGEQQLFPSVREVIHHILNPNVGPVFATFAYDRQGKIRTAEAPERLAIG